jgi:hypothetical protein
MTTKRGYFVAIIRANGAIEVSQSAKVPLLSVLQKAVDGYIETIPYFDKLSYNGVNYQRGTAYCNEEGLYKKADQPNATATKMWREACPNGDPSRMALFGDVIFYAKEPVKKD